MPRIERARQQLIDGRMTLANAMSDAVELRQGGTGHTALYRAIARDLEEALVRIDRALAKVKAI